MYMDPASGIPHRKKKEQGLGFFNRSDLLNSDLFTSETVFEKKRSLRILSGAVILPKSIPLQGELCSTFKPFNCTCTILLSAAVEHVMSQLIYSK